MKAIIYAAKSTEDTHGSIPTQLEDCRLMAEREGWEVVDEFEDEAVSAYHGNRGPGLAAAKQRAIENAPCVLVAQDADRFARGSGDAPGAADHLGELFFQMRRQGVELWTVRSRKLDELRAVIEGSRAHDETARKAQAVKAGIDRRRAKGKAWGEAPLGYRVQRRIGDDDDVITTRIIDPQGSQIIEALFSELDMGASTGAVARKLNRAGHRTRRGNAFTARRVRAMASNRDYLGDGPYPRIIDPALFERVNDKLHRADPAAVQNARGGRQPKADFMLRRLCWCAECGQPVYAIVHHGKRLYRCKASLQYTGTCSSLPIPAELAEQRILDHLGLFVGHVEDWIGERLAERSDEQQALQSALDARRRELSSLDAQREKRMAEMTTIGITPVGLEVIERIDSERAGRQRDIEEAEAVLSEWTARLSADSALDFYNRIVDVVQGRVARAQGMAEINAVLHDTLLGVWLGFDGRTMTADIKVRPSGLDEYDAAVAELFGTLGPWREAIEMLQRLLPDEAEEATISRPRT
jgi:DNA invertase Pin-like site-specific DNA recombinase